MESEFVSMADFEKIDIRTGVIVEVEPFQEGRYSTHILKIDFGPEVGTKKSLARLSPNYGGPELLGRMVLAVVNFAPRQIGPHRSEVLTLGLPDADGNTVLIRPDRDIPPGGRLH